MTDGEWLFEDSTIQVQAGDTINYWILVIINGEGFQVGTLQIMMEGG